KIGGSAPSLARIWRIIAIPLLFIDPCRSPCLREEGRLRQQNVNIAQANFMHGNGKGKTNKGWKGGKTNNSNHKGSSNLSVQSTSKKIKKDECKFCHKVGHIQRDCIKRKEWF
ncbi:hypothetical protein LINPERPRIM_LOCUS5961, partial [Linum perenne]